MHIHEFDAAVHLDNLLSPLSIKKLEKTQDDIKALIENLDEDTTLIVASDHGVSINGHGGFEEAEETGVFFAYRKKGFAGTRNPSLVNTREIYREMDICNIAHYYMGSTSPLNSYGDLPPEVL